MPGWLGHILKSPTCTVVSATARTLVSQLLEVLVTAESSRPPVPLIES